MGTITGTALINEVANKLRDPNNTGYSRAMVLRMLNASQDLINMRLGLVLGSATLTTANTSVYSLSSAVATNAARVLTIRESNRELSNVPWNRLLFEDVEWLRRFGKRAQMWSQIGRELLIVSPIPEVSTSLTVVYVKHPTAILDNGVSTSELPDEHMSILTDLTEAICLFRSREFNALQGTLDGVAKALGMEDAAQIVRKGTMGRTN